MGYVLCEQSAPYEAVSDSASQGTWCISSVSHPLVTLLTIKKFPRNVGQLALHENVHAPKQASVDTTIEKFSDLLLTAHCVGPSNAGGADV